MSVKTLEKKPIVNSVEKEDLWKLLAHNSAFALELITGAMKERDKQRAIFFLVNKLAQRLDCLQVAFGRVRRGDCRLVAVSAMAKFNQRAPIVHAIQAAMNESMREKKIIEYPQSLQERTLQIDLAHKDLTDVSNAAQVLSAPVKVEDEIVGVWTFLWAGKNALDPGKKNLILALIPILGPFWQLLLQTRQSVISRTKEKTFSILWRLRYFLVLLMFVPLGWIMTFTFPHYVHAKCELQPETRRIVAAPFDGILFKVYCKPGDVVTRGKLLAEMDGKELRWDLETLKANRAKKLKEIEIALAQEKILEYEMISLEEKKLSLQIRLIEHRLSRLEIRSPIDGIIITGDLKKSHGVPLTIGQGLFEVAPLKQMLAEIAVEARDISYVHEDLAAQLQFESEPGHYLPVKIRSLKPNSEIRDATNVFIWEAIIDNPEGKLRPGLEGVVRIQSGAKPLWWILFHRPIEWLRMQFWK